jgi:hypothetical protein
VPRPFGLAPGVVVPAGEYKNRLVDVSFGSARGRWWGIDAAYSMGSFYGGNITSGALNLTLQPVARVRILSENLYDDVTIPSGAFKSLVTRLYFSYYFSPALTTRLGLQYSSLHEESVLNFRVRWIYTPGSEAWLVYDEGRRFDRPGESALLTDRAFIVKVVHNFHF